MMIEVEIGKSGKKILRTSNSEIHELRAIDRMRSMLTGEEPEEPTDTEK